MTISVELPVLPFDSPRRWEAWLAKNHTQSGGVWLQRFKKDSARKTITYDEALEGALCYGWIDGQAKKHDAESWLQKFTPRRPRSIWSKRNVARVERLIEDGRMKPAGLEQIEAAKADGRWQRAYDSPSKMAVPDDFLKALAKDSKAKAFFGTLNRTNVYAIAWRLQTAKSPETRQRRMDQLLAMLANQEKLH